MHLRQCREKAAAESRVRDQRQADAHPRPGLAADEREGRSAHLLGGLGLVRMSTMTTECRPRAAAVRSDRSGVLTRIGLDRDRDDPGVDGLLEEAGDLESTQSVGLADLDLRSSFEVVIAGQLREEPAVAGGGARGAHRSSLGVDGIVFAQM